MHCIKDLSGCQHMSTNHLCLEYPNITRFYIIFPPLFPPFLLAAVSSSFTFSKWTNVGHRFLIKITIYCFPRHRVENPWWRAMTILVVCVLEDVWKIQCMSLGFSIFADIFLYFEGQGLVSKQKHWKSGIFHFQNLLRG